MIERDLAPFVRRAAGQFPAVTLTGPRQSGKSTLCRNLFPDFHYANLESPDMRQYAQEDPRSFIADLGGGAIIDEIQNVPELASWLQVQIDEKPAPGQWILTGSQNFALTESVSQSLAGRSAVQHLMPLTLNEVQRFPDMRDASLEQLILGGGYPRIYDRQIEPADWLASYVATYVERDVRSISSISDLNAFQRFLGFVPGAADRYSTTRRWPMTAALPSLPPRPGFPSSKPASSFFSFLRGPAMFESDWPAAQGSSFSTAGCFAGYWIFERRHN